MPKEKSKLDVKVARYFDILVGIYFSSKLDREAETVGEFIVSSKPLLPDYFNEWLKEPVKL